LSGRVRILAGLVGLTLVLTPAAAVAQGPSNPLAPGIPASPQTVPTQTTPTVINPTTAGGSDSGLTGGAAVAIAIGAIVLLTAISFFIWRDARKRAPVKHAHAAAEFGGRSGSKRPPKPRKLSPAERRRRKRGRAR
jgi:hypothetical protein